TGDIRPGGQITVTGTGFPANAAVRVELHSDPVLLGTTTASGSGSFTLHATIPSSIKGNLHTVVVSVGGVTLASQAVTLGGLSSTGAEAPIVGTVAAGVILLLAAGGALLVAARRREAVEG